VIPAARLGFAVAGFVFALGAVVLDDHRVAWGAIALLAVSLLLRLVTRRRDTSS
jgi:hypothetical protein